jgi:hypothetical protein
MPGLVVPFITFTAIYVFLGFVVGAIFWHQVRGADEAAHERGEA